MSRKKKASKGLPTRKQILDYLKDADGGTQRRDIARAFNIKGDKRAELRRLLKEMEADGALERSGKSRFSQRGALPPVAPIDVMSVDDDGDLVCMPANWRGDDDPPLIRIALRHAQKQKPTPGVGDRLLARLKSAGDGGYDAEIIKAIGKGAHRFFAVFRKTKNGGVAEPVERRARTKFNIDASETKGAEDGDLVWVESIARRPGGRGRETMQGRVRDIAGHVDDPAAYSLIALANHGIPVELPAETIREAEQAKSPPLGEREDLRSIPLLTIDPADAKDHDDAVWATPDDDPANKGGFKVMVAIADVSFFVRPGSALDKEALKRGNSVYLPDRVVPMLPERLSNDLCSLREDEDRPCIAVEMTLASDGRKLRHKFMRAMMRSAAKLSYEDAQKIINAGKRKDEVGKAVVTLHAAFKARWAERKKRAPLDLDLPERKIVMGDDSTVDKIVRKERLDAHRLIEEFMILANISAAETLERAKVEQIYRVHDAPDPEKLDGLRKYLETLDYSLIKGGSIRPTHFNQLLKLAEARDEKEMVSEVVLRAQQQAVYATENLGHFGLNLARYSHFTSPIRRYADLTIHRALVRACKLGPGGQTEKEADALDDIAEQISDLERRAMAAEREASDRYLSEYLAGRIGAEFDARIRGVTRFGLFVMLDETGADGFIPMRSIGFERFRFEEARHSIIGESTGGVYRLGQSVRVKLAEATPLTGGLRFEMISDPIPDPGGKKRTSRGGEKSGRRSSSTKKSKKTARRKPKSGGDAGNRQQQKAAGKPKKKPRKKPNAKPRAR